MINSRRWDFRTWWGVLNAVNCFLWLFLFFSLSLSLFVQNLIQKIRIELIQWNFPASNEFWPDSAWTRTDLAKNKPGSKPIRWNIPDSNWFQLELEPIQPRLNPVQTWFNESFPIQTGSGQIRIRSEEIFPIQKNVWPDLMKIFRFDEGFSIQTGSDLIQFQFSLD